MFQRLQPLITQKYAVGFFVRRYANGSGSGTVNNPDGIFSEREAKAADDLKKLKAELKKRKRRKKEGQDSSDVESGEGQGGGKGSGSA
ncbi:unnamed protein product [Tenebrio molitor]|nr:unnamed protein product [Tenebrio molitor]